MDKWFAYQLGCRMSLKSKAKAARKREQLKASREREIQKDLERVSELKTRTAGFARTSRSEAVEAAFKQSKMPTYAKQRAVEHTRSTAERFDLSYGNKRPAVMGEATAEMIERQAQAQEQAKLFKNRVAPVGNKMGPQLLTDSELAAERRGELRRRS